MCKGKHPYDKKNFTVIGMFKKYYRKYYAIEPKEHLNDFRMCIFEKLFEVYMKIRQDGSGHNLDLKSIYYASFHKSMVRYQEDPVERAIAELYGQIQYTRVRVRVGKRLLWRFDIY